MRTICLAVCLLVLVAGFASAALITGKVLAPDAKPIAGATVVIDPDFSMRRDITVRSGESGEFSVEVKSPARWPDVFGRACVYAPGFALDGALLKQGENVFRLERPGIASGTVTDEGGRPVSGAVIRVTSARPSDPRRGFVVLGEIRDKVAAKSGPDGRWTIHGLPASGKARVVLDDPRYIHESVEAPLGTNPTLAPRLVARPGSTIAGRVVFEGGKPAKGIGVMAQGQHDNPGWSQAMTSADGSYRLSSLAAGIYNVMVDDPAGRWVAAAREGVNLGKAQSTSVHDLTLTSGAMIEGTVTDSDTGKSLPGASIGSYGPHRPRSSAAIIGTHTDEKGHYRLRVAPGKSYVYVSGPPQGYLRPEGGVDVTVAKGEAKQVDFRLSEDRAAKLPKLTLTGRVATTNGQPIADATVFAQIITPVGGGGRRGVSLGERRQVTTDKEGRYSVPDIRADSEVLSVTAEKPGYKWVSGGAVTKRENSLSASDIILTPAKAKVEGRAVDGTGAPVVGARVMCADGDPGEEAVTDSDGRFSLGSLPEGEVLLVAGHGRELGDARGQAGGPTVTITIGPAKPIASSDIQRGYAILKEAWEASAGTEYYARESLAAELAPYDADLALKLTTPDGLTADRALSGVLSAVVDADPVRGTEWAAPRVDGVEDPSVKAYTLAFLALRAVNANPNAAAALYRRAAEEIKSGARGSPEDPGPLFARWMLAAVAAKLEYPEAATLLEDARGETRKEFGDDPHGMWKAAVGVLAMSSPELAERVASDLPGRSRMGALADAVEQISRYDVPAARRLFSKIQPPTQEGESHSYGVAAKTLIVAIGKADPAATLEIAREVKSKEQRPLALALAAQFQERDLARQLFREAAEAVSGDAGRIAWFAALASESDPDLSAELFAAARKALPAGGGNPQFAFYYARVDPAESRLMMEAELSRRRQQGGEHGHFFSLVSPTLAMAAVDVDRALVLARSIPAGGSDGHFDAQRKIAQYVLATDAVRRTMLFDRWAASDTWRPGTPTGW